MRDGGDVTAQEAWMETYRGRVASWECDHLGHMNVQFYVARISDASAALTNAMGLTAGYLRERRRALAAVHHDISYLAEVKAGDLLLMRSGILSAEGKKVRFAHRMMRIEDGKPVMRAKVFMISMDLEQRRSIAVEEFILERTRLLLVDESEL
jgi:acyl-CoA thioester hydrolase